MPATTNVNFRTVVHEKSNGIATFFPDVCKTPAPPAPPVPIPYPNIAQSSQMAQGSTQVKIDGSSVMLQGSNFSTSTGDEAGSAGGGVASNTIKGKAEFVNYSFDVKIQGKNVPRLGDMMLGNKQSSPNTPPMPEVQPPIVVVPPMDNDQTEEVKLDKLEETDPEAADHLESYGADDRSRDTGKKLQGEPANNTEEKEPVPTVKAKWGKTEILPPHFEDPAKSGSGDVPDDAKVELVVETTDVPDGIDAFLEVVHAQSGRNVTGDSFGKLKVKGNKLVDTSKNSAPEWHLPAHELPWDPWDEPFYAFKLKLDYKSLEFSTPKDFNNQEADTLRLKYRHACISDAVADTGRRPLSTQDEMREIKGILEGLPHHEAQGKAMSEEDLDNGLPGILGEAVRNTYVFHNASHGTTGAIIYCHLDDKRYAKITADELSDKEIFPTVPRYLAYLNCCLTGAEPGIARAMTSRGTRNVIAFKISIPDISARSMAYLFYSFWCEEHQCDPKKIPKVYKQVSPSFEQSMEPVLYGKGGEKTSSGPSVLEIAAIAIGAIALGIAIGATAAKLLK